MTIINNRSAMRNNALIITRLVCFIACISNNVNAQNKNFIVNFAIGAGNSGFKIEETGGDEVKRIFYPMGGIQIQKRINTKWALNLFPNVGMSGNDRILSNPINSITRIKTSSAFINFAVHPKYYFNETFYFSAGPELAYLLWNYGSAYNDENRLSHLEETKYFNRINLLVSSSLGISIKVGESRKKAPVQIDALWYLEFRIKKGITNILNKDFFGNEAKTSILSLELVTGISFASKN